jgi:protein phosphatase PTC6
MIGTSRELTVVRIPLRSAKHHFGVSLSRGTRPYNEDTYQAGTIEMPAFAKRAPISLTRSPHSTNKDNEGEATSAEGASGDPQVFYFGIFDGHGGSECSEFLKDELHKYIESAGEEFELKSSLRKTLAKVKPSHLDSEPSMKGRGSFSTVQIRSEDDIKPNEMVPQRSEDNSLMRSPTVTIADGQSQTRKANKPSAIDLELSLVKQWRDTVGGYFRRFSPQYFSVSSVSGRSQPDELQKEKDSSPVSIETVLMYAFLRADLDFITAQVSKPDLDSVSDLPLNNDEILGEPSRPHYHKRLIGGPTRFKGGSTASVAMISTPTPTPFWHPATPSTLVVAHCGDTRILLCETSTGLAVSLTTNHHPSSPIEGTRLRRYAGSFVTDSFGEERMSGLANTRAFGDMHSKRIGVSAEPELRRQELGPAQYSFMVLVSDGVSGTLSDQEIVDVVKESKTPDQGARDVVSFATEVTKEGDNATCLVVRLGGWERRAEGGMGSLGTKEARDFRRQEATDPRSRRR